MSPEHGLRFHRRTHAGAGKLCRAANSGLLPLPVRMRQSRPRPVRLQAELTSCTASRSGRSSQRGSQRTLKGTSGQSGQAEGSGLDRADRRAGRELPWVWSPVAHCLPWGGPFGGTGRERGWLVTMRTSAGPHGTQAGQCSAPQPAASCHVGVAFGPRPVAMDRTCGLRSPSQVSESSAA